MKRPGKDILSSSFIHLIVVPGAILTTLGQYEFPIILTITSDVSLPKTSGTSTSGDPIPKGVMSLDDFSLNSASSASVYTGPSDNIVFGVSVSLSHTSSPIAPRSVEPTACESCLVNKMTKHTGSLIRPLRSAFLQYGNLVKRMSGSCQYHFPSYLSPRGSGRRYPLWSVPRPDGLFCPFQSRIRWLRH